jgi:hypothetical protein
LKLFGPMALAALVSFHAFAAQSDDPDWPCVQRRVDHLSLAVMWPNPVSQDAEVLSPELQDIAEQMALRRVSIEEVESLVDDIAQQRPDLGAEEYGRIFAEAFERIDVRRTRIIEGIVRYARGQARLAEEVDALRSEFARVESAEEPDFDRLDDLEEQIDWRERVFDDRNSALTYVCETPVLLERRAYAIAQILLRKVD